MRMFIHRHLTCAVVMATIAVFVALGGSAFAASYVITSSSQIKNGAVTSSAVKNSSLTGSDIKDSGLTNSDVKISSLTLALDSPDRAVLAGSGPGGASELAQAKTLARALGKARSSSARVRALTRIMRSLGVGVITSSGAPVVVAVEKGAASRVQLYDFELRTLAAALARRQEKTYSDVAAALSSVGFKLSAGKDFPPELLHDAVTEAVRAGHRRGAHGFLLALLVQQLGQRRGQDPAGKTPTSEVRLDALQAWLLGADFAIGALRKLPAPTSARLAGARAASLPDVCQKYRLAVEAAKKATTPPLPTKVSDAAKNVLRRKINKYAVKFIPGWAVRGAWKVGARVKDANGLLKIVHGSLLALSVSVTTPDSVLSPAHWGHDGPGDTLEFRERVWMLDDYGDLAVKCGALVGLELPPQGPIKDVTVNWGQPEGDIKDEGALDCPPPALPLIGNFLGKFICVTKTGDDGIARVHLITNREVRPGFGSQLENTGLMSGVALYQSAAGGGITGFIGQFLFPKDGGGTRWFVRSHRCGGVIAATVNVASVAHARASQSAGTCGATPPQTISGTVAGSNTYDPIKVAWSGSATFTFQPNEPFTGLPWPQVGDDDWHYTLTSGSVTWSAADTPGSPCSVSGGGTLGPGDVHGELLIHAPDDLQESPGWRYEAMASPAPGVTMPMTLTCPRPEDPDPIVRELNAVDWAGGSATLTTIYNGYTTGQPVTNRYTPDLRLFSGSILTPTGEQTWTWALTGTGNAGS